MDEREASKRALSELGWPVDRIGSLGSPIFGTSGAIVSFYCRTDDANQKCAVKCVRKGAARVSLALEAVRRNYLVPYIQKHIPRVLWIGQIQGFEVMISECPAIETLQHRVEREFSPELQNVWRKCLSEVAAMWDQSCDSYDGSLTTRPHGGRIERIRRGIESFPNIGNGLKNPVIINDREFPSIEETLQQIASISPPKFGVTCHGDPQATNLLISDHYEWHMIDWEWSGPHHDWRMSLGHLYGWWATRFVEQQQIPTVYSKRERLHLDYAARVSDRGQSLQGEVRRLVEDMPGVDALDIRSVNLFLALLYLGELRFLGIGRVDLAAPLVGEAIKLTAAIKHGDFAPDESFGLLWRG